MCVKPYDSVAFWAGCQNSSSSEALTPAESAAGTRLYWVPGHLMAQEGEPLVMDSWCRLMHVVYTPDYQYVKHQL